MRLLCVFLIGLALSLAVPKVKELCTTQGCFITPHEDDNTGQQVPGTNIWIGNQFASVNQKWLKEAGITHIVSAIGEPQTGRIEGITYKIFDLEDSHDQHVLPHIYELHEYLTKEVGSTGKVLIHCAAGVSRSASFVIGHLMLSDWNLGIESAIQLVKSVRDVINPNARFLLDLYELDTNLYVMKLNETAHLGNYISQLKEEL